MPTLPESSRAPSGGDASADPSQVRLSLAAPAYDEAEGIGSVVRQWCAGLRAANCTFEIVICDDGSRDGTGDVLKELQREVSALHVVRREQNHGYGSALNAAIANCQGTFIATIDSDGQFLVQDVCAMLRALEAGSCDAVLGYRTRKSDTWLRRLADRALNGMVRLLFRVRLRDSNCALKAIHRDVLQALNIEAAGFAFPTEVSLKVIEHGARVLELPVQHQDRGSGSSKLRVWRVGWQTLKFLVYLRLRLSLYRAGILQRF